MEDLVAKYLTALESGDPAVALRLFASDAIVHSPLYGTMPAQQFYPRLFADTSSSTLTLRQVFRDGDDAIAFLFDFDWVLSNGSPAPFTVVDIARLDANGLITELRIVYDTFPIRGAFDQATAVAP